MFPIKFETKMIQYNTSDTVITPVYPTYAWIINPWTATTTPNKFTSDAFENMALNNLMNLIIAYDETISWYNYVMSLEQTEISSTDIDYFIEKEFLPNDDFCFNVDDYDGKHKSVGEFRFGVEWPFDWKTYTEFPDINYSSQVFDLDLKGGAVYQPKFFDFNEIETYFANKSSVPTFDVSYTIKLEQVE